MIENWMYPQPVLVVPFESIQPFGYRFFQEANHYWYLLALRYVHIAMMSLLLPLAWAFKKDDTSPFLASAKDVGVFLPLWVPWLSLLHLHHFGRCFNHIPAELSFESAFGHLCVHNTTLKSGCLQLLLGSSAIESFGVSL